jgi:hypothetical protein
MSETRTTTIVRAFEPKAGKSAKGDWVRCDFEFEGGLKASTFNGGVASAATALVGQPVEIEYEEKQNGEYTNRTLLKVSAVNGNGAAPTASIQDHVEVAQNTAGPSHEETRQLRIMRQSGLDRALTAFGIAGQDPIESLDEVYQLSDQFIDYFVNGITE